jgi:hypothetical protein
MPRPRTFVYIAPPKPPRPRAKPKKRPSPSDIAKEIAKGMQRGEKYRDGEYPLALIAVAKAMIGGK